MWSAIAEKLFDKLNWKSAVILIVGTGLVLASVSFGWFGSFVSMFFGEISRVMPTDGFGQAFPLLVNGAKWLNYLYGFPIVGYVLYAFFWFLRVSLAFGWLRFTFWLAEKFS